MKICYKKNFLSGPLMGMSTNEWIGLPDDVPQWRVNQLTDSLRANQFATTYEGDRYIITEVEILS